MSNKRNLGIMFATLVIVMLGFGIIIPILPFYIEQYGGGGIEMGMLLAIFSLMQLIFSPIWGSLSDRVGRKPMMMVGAAGNAIGMIWMAYADRYAVLFGARMLMGILTSATLPSVLAYISDSTDEKVRGGAMGLWGAAFGLGMMLGPGIGGSLSTISLQAPFFFAAAASILAMLVIWFFLPESLQPPDRTAKGERLRRLSPREMFGAVSGPVGYLLVLALLQNFALTNFEGIFPLYTQLRYDFDAPTIGLILTVDGFIGAVVQGLVTGPATRRFGDSAVVKGSLLASAVGFLALLTAVNLGWVLVTSAAFILANSMLRPGVASLTSKRTNLGQGATMGLSNSFMALGRILGPLWAGAALDLDLRYPFLTGAAVMLIAYAASVRHLRSDDALKRAQDTAPTGIS